MKTKAYVRYLNRLARFATDIEVLDALVRGVPKLTPHAHKLFAGATKTDHPRLHGHKVSAHNRKLVTAHLKSTLYGAYIKDLYEEFSDYLRDAVRACARNGLAPGRMIGEHRFTIEANDILSAGSWDAVANLIADSLFRTLEEMRNTRKMVQAVDRKLGLHVDKALLEAAMPYLDLRHRLVHGDGTADKTYAKCYPAMGAKDGKTIDVDYKCARAAEQSISALVEAIDKGVVAHVGETDRQS